MCRYTQSISATKKEKSADGKQANELKVKDAAHAYAFIPKSLSKRKDGQWKNHVPYLCLLAQNEKKKKNEKKYYHKGRPLRIHIRRI